MLKLRLNRILSFLETKRGATIALFIIYICGVLFTGLVINASAYGPIHFNDEVQYWSIASSIYDGSFTVADYHHYPPVYSISLLPAFLFFSKYVTYSAAKFLNALYITSVVFPVYLIFRQFLNRRSSLVSAALLLLYPVHLVMPRSLISENVFYPLFMWALLFAFTNVLPDSKRNRLIENIIFGLLLALLMLTRYIALVIAPALLFVWWLKPCEKEKTAFMISKEKVFHLLVILIPVIVVMGIWLAAGVSGGVPVKDLLGFFLTASPDPAQLGKRRLLMWAIFYCSYTVLMAAPYLPILFASITEFDFKKWREGLNRWWIALIVILFVFLVACIRHSWRAWYNYPDPKKVQGRYILYFGPLFLITAILSIKELVRTKKKTILLILILLLSIALFIFSYLVLFEGFIYLDQALGISVSSPYGYLLLGLKENYIVFIFAVSFALAFLIHRRSKLLYKAVVIFMAVLFIWGGYKIYDGNLIPRQKPNLQITRVMNEIKKSDRVWADFRSYPIEIYANSDVSDAWLKRWLYTLTFSGYTDCEVNRDDEGTMEPSVYLQVRFDQNILNLLLVEKEEYEQCDCAKFASEENFYIIPELPLSR